MKLRMQHETLIAAELSGEVTDARELKSQQHKRLDVSAWIGDLLLRLMEQAAPNRVLELGVGGAASFDRPPPVVDPRYEPLLKHPGEMDLAGEEEPLARPYDELERRLAEAVLKILLAQAVAVGVEQQRPLGREDERDALSGVLAGP